MNRKTSHRALSHLGHVLAVLRHRRGWSREELARASELSVKTVARYEDSGRTPSLPTLDAVLTALDYRLDDVLIAERHAGLGQRAERLELKAQVVDIQERLETLQQDLLVTASREALALARSLASTPREALDRERWLQETRVLAAHLGELRGTLALEPPAGYAVDYVDLAELGLEHPTRLAANDH